MNRHFPDAHDLEPVPLHDDGGSLGQAEAEQIWIFLDDGDQVIDYGTAVLRFENGALGTVTASRVSHGRENDLGIKIDGRKDSLTWHQEEPNKMLLRINGQQHRLYTIDPAAAHTQTAARRSCRLPAGHPEGFLEAFANLYTAVYKDVIARALGRKWNVSRSLYPTVADGVEGMHFVTKCVANSQGNGAWMPL